MKLVTLADVWTLTFDEDEFVAWFSAHHAF
jgi:hypothetical protein